MTRNWQEAFQYGGSLTPQMLEWLQSLEVDLAKAGLGGGGATSLTDLTDVTGAGGVNQAPVDDGSGNFPLTEVVKREDLDQILADVAAVHWIEPPLLSGFQNMGAPWAPVRYRLALNSSVYIEGLVVHQGPLGSEDAPLPIFQLPPEASPGGDLMFISPSGGLSISTTVVKADGLVEWGSYITVGEGAEIFISLSNIVYSIGAVTAPLTW